MEQTSTLSSQAAESSRSHHHTPEEGGAATHHIQQPDVHPGQRMSHWRPASIAASFYHAFSGIWYLISTQRNAQIHVFIGTCALGLGAVLGLERWEWLTLVLTIVLVLAAEGFNTAIECAVDVATNTYHPLARIAKDVAAGAVLLCALAAVLVGCLLFLPHLWPIVVWVFTRA